MSAAAFAAIALVLFGCSSNKPAPTGDDDAPVTTAGFVLTSDAFAEGQPIPAKYTFYGDDVSPPLCWSGMPEETKQLALICDDPDAPSPENPNPDPWVHWVIYKIPPDVTGLPEGVATDAKLDEPAGALQGKNSWDDGRTIGYRGPQPPGGTHRYFFRLYALDAELGLKPVMDKASLLKVMKGHVLGQTQLMGTYQR